MELVLFELSGGGGGAYVSPGPKQTSSSPAQIELSRASY